MTDELPTATRKFWHLEGTTVAREIRDCAAARLAAGDEIVEFHIHERNLPCPGFATAMRTDEETGDVILPADTCWRAKSTI